MIDSDPKLTDLKPVVVIERFPRDIDQRLHGQVSQGHAPKNQGESDGQGRGLKPVTPIKLTKVSDLQEELKRLTKTVEAKDKEVKVLTEKNLFYEDELCKKNTIIKELEEELRSLFDNPPEPSLDVTNETNVTAKDDDDNDNAKDGGDNLDDSIEILRQCKAIAKKGSEGLLNIKSEPTEGHNDFDQMFKDLKGLQTPRKEQSVEAVSLDTSSLLGTMFETPAEIVKKRTRTRKKSVIASLESGPVADDPNNDIQVVIDTKKTYKKKPRSKTARDSPAAKTMTKWLTKGASADADKAEKETTKGLDEDVKPPIVKIKSFAKLCASTDNVMKP